MTGIVDTSTLLVEIEDFLRLSAGRELFSSQEVQDFLLDLRNLVEAENN